MGEVLFIKHTNSSFVRRDEAFLARNYVTSVFYFKGGAFGRLLLSEAALTLWLLRHIWASKLIFVWFADYHSLIPTLLARVSRKRCAIVIGGYDAAKIPHLGYGAQVRRFRGFCVRVSCRFADVILPVSEFVRKNILRLCRGTECRMVYNGVDPAFFSMMGRKEDLVLTVCGVGDMRRMLIKGVDFFCDVARAMPDLAFILVGVTGAAKRFAEDRKIDNLRVLGRLSQEELLGYYRKAKVYCQFSVYEAFGMALAEAMLCECIPVGSDCGAIPEIIGHAGFIVENRSTAEALETIREALSQRDESGRLARQRIVENFLVQRKKQVLRGMIDGMLSRCSAWMDRCCGSCCTGKEGGA